jgi:hypothetical protein
LTPVNARAPKWLHTAILHHPMEVRMQENAVPKYDASVNTTGCCPKFNPEGWDGQDLHFRDKPFVRAETRSVMHVPLNMGHVFARVNEHMEAAQAIDFDDYIVLSHDLSSFTGEHYFAAAKPVPDEDMTALSGDFVTKVFEGPYAEAKSWHEEMQNMVRARGSEPGRVFFFYTTCPKCAKAYGKNYVVGVAEV